MSGKTTPLNFLRAFDCAGKHLSFKLAAEELHVSPPAVSHQIKALEERLGVQLFLRNNRELSFTGAGETYWKQVHDSLAQLDAHTQALRQGYSQTRLLVSVIPSLASSLIIPNLATFQREHPLVTLHIDSSIKNISIEEGQADLVIRFGKGDWPNLTSEKLLDLYMQPIYPKSFATRYDFSDSESTSRVPLIHNNASPDAWHRWSQASDMDISKPDREYHFSDYPATIEAAKTLGGALAVMPIENELIHRGAVIAPFPRWGPIEEKVYAVFRPADSNNPLIAQFICWVKTLLATLDSG